MSTAIIPARGGSKGIEKKNIADLQGQPLISYTIEQAKASELVDSVYVSTDDAEIASVSESWGATVIDRPDELADDEASTENALLHAIDYLEARGEYPEVTTLLQCTCPLRREDDIDETVALVTAEGYDSALTCCPDYEFYWTIDGESATPLNYDPKNRKRRQDMERRYQETGSIYVVETELLVEEECRLGGDVGIHEMPEAYSFDIDTPEDLRIVESVAMEFDFYPGVN